LKHSPMLKNLASVVSVVFHPLLVPSYMLLLLLLINPYLFGVSSVQAPEARLLLLLVFLYTFFMPAVAFVVMYFLGFISDLQVPDRQERIAPYLITGLLYMWVYYNFSKTGQMPPAYISFMLGTVIALFAAFLLNIFTKVSAHTVGMGGLLAMLLISMLRFSYGSFALEVRHGGTVDVSVLYLFILFVVVAGAVGTARLLLKAHDLPDVAGGYFIGFVAQFVALMIVF